MDLAGDAQAQGTAKSSWPLLKCNIALCDWSESWFYRVPMHSRTSSFSSQISTPTSGLLDFSLRIAWVGKRSNDVELAPGGAQHRRKTCSPTPPQLQLKSSHYRNGRHPRMQSIPRACRGQNVVAFPPRFHVLMLAAWIRKMLTSIAATPLVAQLTNPTKKWRVAGGCLMSMWNASACGSDTEPLQNCPASQPPHQVVATVHAGNRAERASTYQIHCACVVPCFG